MSYRRATIFSSSLRCMVVRARLHDNGNAVKEDTEFNDS